MDVGGIGMLGNSHPGLLPPLCGGCKAMLRGEVRRWRLGGLGRAQSKQNLGEG